MNREIKYRAFNIDSSEMYFDVQDAYDYMNGHGASSDGEVVPATHFGEILRDDGWVVMQYTGREDKYGRRIYEGDILDDDERYFQKERGVVVWNADLAGFDIDGAEKVTSGLRYSHWVVVGNTFENSDLLEATHA